MTVHFEAKRLGLRKVPREEMPHLGRTLRADGYLLLPIVALIGYLYYGFSEEMAALMAVGTTFLVSLRAQALGARPRAAAQGLRERRPGRASPWPWRWRRPG